MSTKPVNYDMFYGVRWSDMILLAKLMMKKLKKRLSIMEMASTGKAIIISGFEIKKRKILGQFTNMSQPIMVDLG